ncbi:MAG: M28 family peptidase [Planctomycetota bacterium]
MAPARLLALSCALLLSSPVLAQQADKTITSAEIQAHVDFLASDLLEGRDSGYPGAEIAALYVATHFRRCGLAPLFDDYQMEFDLPGAAGPGTALLSYGGQLLNDPKQISVRGFSAVTSVAGMTAQGDEDPAGKIVIAPGGSSSDADHKRAMDLARRGAEAVLFVSDRDEFPVSARPDGRRRPAGRSSSADRGGGYLESAPLRSVPGEALSIPVIRVSRRLGADLLDAVEDGATLSIEVTREGVDRSANVIGWIEGSDPELKKEYVFAGAHYDHVGADHQGNIWNGADDNASGTAGILEFADALASLKERPRRSIILAAWSAEERGLVGSKAFMRNCPVPLEKICAYINLDMISRNDPEFVDVVHASDDLLEMMREKAKSHGLEVNEGSARYLAQSDCLPFAENEIPVLFPFTDIHEDYHRPSDDPDTIDADKAMRVTRAAFQVLLEVANADGRPSFSASRSGNRRGGGSLRLGFTPGDSQEAPGIPVGTVLDGSVAESAGLLPGDTLIRIGEQKIGFRKDLKQALQAVREAESFEIEVLRNGQPLILEGSFKNRSL